MFSLVSDLSLAAGCNKTVLHRILITTHWDLKGQQKFCSSILSFHSTSWPWSLMFHTSSPPVNGDWKTGAGDRPTWISQEVPLQCVFLLCSNWEVFSTDSRRSPSIHGELHGESHPESRHQQSLPFQPIPSTAFDSVELHEQKGEEHDMVVCPPLTTHSSFFTVKLLSSLSHLPNFTSGLQIYEFSGLETRDKCLIHLGQHKLY